MMKKLIFLLLFPVVCFAQHPAIWDVSRILFVSPNTPVLSGNPTTLVLTSVSGSQGGSQSYRLAGSNLGSNAVTVPTPLGYVSSIDNSTFSTNAITVNPVSGAVNQLIYYALASTNGAGTLNATATATCTVGSSNLSVPITLKGTVSAPAGTFSASPTSIAGLNGNQGTAGTSQTVTATFANSTITATAPTNTEISKDGGSTWSGSQSFSTGSPLALRIRTQASASAGAVSGNLAFTGTNSAPSQNVAVSGTISPATVAKGVDTVMSQSYSNVSTMPINFSSFTSSYRYMKIVFYDVTASTSGALLEAQVSANGTTFDAGTANYTWVYTAKTSPTSSSTGDVAATIYGISGGMTTTTGSGLSGYVEVFNPNSSTKQPQGLGVVNGTGLLDISFAFTRLNVQQFKGFQLLPSTGTLSGKIYIIGIH